MRVRLFVFSVVAAAAMLVPTGTASAQDRVCVPQTTVCVSQTVTDPAQELAQQLLDTAGPLAQEAVQTAGEAVAGVLARLEDDGDTCRGTSVGEICVEGVGDQLDEVDRIVCAALPPNVAGPRDCHD